MRFFGVRLWGILTLLWHLACASWDCDDDGSCTLTCNTKNACKEQTYACDVGSVHCQVNCEAQGACQKAILTCPDGASCSFNCIGKQACKEAQLGCPSDQACALVCHGDQACKETELTGVNNFCLDTTTASAIDLNCDHDQCAAAPFCYASIAAFNGAMELSRCDDPDTQSGDSENRTMYSAATVNAPAICQSESQSRVCSDGTWQEWNGSHTESSCTELSRCSSPDTESGDSKSRTMYSMSTVNAPATCQGEVQSRTCIDGVWQGWSGSYAAGSCMELSRCSDPDTENGDSESRAMYSAATVNAPATCQSESQSRVCSDGTWQEWSGLYLEAECIVSPTSSPNTFPTESPTQSSMVSFPTISPTASPTAKPVPQPTMEPLISQPTPLSTISPTASPTAKPVPKPIMEPPTSQPTPLPTTSPTVLPTPWYTTILPASRPTPHPTVANLASLNTPQPTMPAMQANVFGTACPGDMSYVGDGYCDNTFPYNSNLCSFDGGDCCPSTCTNTLLQACGANGFDCQDPNLPPESTTLNSCTERHSGLLGNGQCDAIVNNRTCLFDLGDCCGQSDPENTTVRDHVHCRDSAAFPTCPHLQSPDKLGDSICHPAPYNTMACGYDGGDCCASTCRGPSCGVGGYNCRDSTATPQCSANHPEWLGDGYCDADLNVLDCNWDGGDCCLDACIGDLCGVNGFDCIEGDEQRKISRRNAVKIQHRHLASEVSERQAAAVLRELVGGEACLDEAANCFEQRKCTSLFALGVNSIDIPTLHRLWACLQVEGLASSSLNSLAGNSNEYQIECIRQHCKTEFLRCKVDLECISSDTRDSNPLFSEFHICMDSRCDASSASPTPSPTRSSQRASAAPITPLTIDVIDGKGLIALVNDLPLAMTTASKVRVGARNLATSIPVRAIDDCVFPVDSANFSEHLLLLERWAPQCNLYDLGRRADSVHATGVLIPVEGGADLLPANMWLRRDMSISAPIFTVTHSTKNAIVSLMGRRDSIHLRLSPLETCDTMHAGGIVFSPGENDSDNVRFPDICCAAADVALASIFYEYDPAAGAREFPVCHDMPNLDVTCVSLVETEICGDSCRSDGMCQDGGAGSTAFSCAYGSDCSDCGSRDGTMPDAEPLGLPTDGAALAARDFLCGSPECVDALSTQYDLFHGVGNTFTNRILSLCSSNKCSVPGFLLEYELPSSTSFIRDSDQSTCCIASQVIAARYSYASFHNFMEFSPFASLCPLGNDQLPVSCRWVDATFSGVPDRTTYQLAREFMCEFPQCIAVLDEMFNDMLNMDRNAASKSPPEEWSQFKGGRIFLDELCQVHDDDSPSAEEELYVEVCDMAPDFYFSVPSSQKSPQCCHASRVLLTELDTQGLRAVGDGLQNSDSTPTLSLLRAKAVVYDNPACLNAFYQTIEYQQLLHPGVYPFVENRTYFNKFFVTDFCWINLALSPQAFQCNSSCCAAADAVISRMLWEKDIALGQAFFPDCPRSRHGVNSSCAIATQTLYPLINEESFTSAASLLCGEDDTSSDGCAGLRADDDLLTNFGIKSIRQFCEDPCRCNGIGGCGFHEDEGYPRPHCYVTQPLVCPRATASLIYNGKAFVDCPLQVDTCQFFDLERTSNLAPHVCSAFVEKGTSVLVKSGETLESTLKLRDKSTDVRAGETSELVKDSSAAAALVGEIDDLLSPWALESALVSVACFQAHVSFLCQTQLKQCTPSSDGSRRPEMGPDVELVDLRIAKNECYNNAQSRAAFCPLPIFNSRFEEDRATSATSTPPSHSHCEFMLNPVRLAPHCLASEDGTKTATTCMDSALFNVLGGNILLRNSLHLGQSLFADDMEMVASSVLSGGFNASEALQFVSCPDPFVKNKGMDPSRITPFVEQMLSESDFPADVFYDNRFCVSPCPSFVFPEAEYQVMYWAYIVPGMVAFFVNLLIVLQIALINMKLINHPKIPVDTSLLVFACVLFGAVGILPSALLYHDLPCGQDCETEPCFQVPSRWCVVNKSSTFFLQIAIHCLAWKLLKLYLSLKNDVFSLRYRIVTNWGGYMVVFFPVASGAISYVLEVDDPTHPSYAMHFVRSGFTCRMRFADLLSEVFLHYGQMGISATIVFVVVVRVIVVITSMRARASGTSLSIRSTSGLTAVAKLIVITILEKAKVMKIMGLGVVALLMLVLSVLSTILSAPVFASFQSDVQGWYDCVKYSFAIRNLFGDTAWDIALTSASISGTECPSLPQSGPSQVILLVSLLTETLIPLLVAMFFASLLQFDTFLTRFSAVCRSARRRKIRTEDCDSDNYLKDDDAFRSIRSFKKVEIVPEPPSILHNVLPSRLGWHDCPDKLASLREQQSTESPTSAKQSIVAIAATITTPITVTDI